MPPHTSANATSNANTAADAMTAFTQQMYAALADEVPGNLVMSPWSLTAALSLAWAGARGATADALRRVLCSPEPLDAALQSAASLERALADAVTDGVALSAARRLFVAIARQADVDPAWSARVADAYGADAGAVDFDADPEAARALINAWVAAHTHDAIPSLLAPDTIDRQTEAVLVDAVHLLAKWSVPFDPRVTRPAPFTRLDGAICQVPTMSMTRSLPWASTDDAEAVRLVYGDGALAMTIILPRPGLFDAVSQRLCGASWRTGLRMKPTEVALMLPRFSVRQGGSVLGALRSMGLGPALGVGADFGDLLRGGGVAISEVVHEACVTVDESGTEAAAATAVVMKRLSMGPPPTRFVVDRPFFFVIEHVPTGAPLFFARVLDPT